MRQTVFNLRPFLSLSAVIALLLIGLPSVRQVAARRESPAVNIFQPIARTAENPRKLALLVGISKYSRTPAKPDQWWDLSTQGDITLLAEVLINRYKFAPEDIKILSDQPVTVNGKTIPATPPTKDTILKTFRSHLTAQAKPGDIVFFHFSGHGQQVPDDDKHGPNPVVGDELDGMDETLIPLDYVSQKDGSKNIRDDEIGQLLDELSQKNPATVTVTLDSCYSGTATRGGETARGAPWQGTPTSAKVRGEDESAADFTGKNQTRGGSSQNYVFLSAASQRQVAHEIKIQDEKTKTEYKYGAFSHALARALDRAGAQTTYRDLFYTVSDVITTAPDFKQNPQIEGAQLDNLVMNQGALPPERFVQIKFSSKGEPYFNAGRLQGLTVGSKYNLCAADAKTCADKDRIAAVEITDVFPTAAKFKLDGTVAPDKLKTVGRAFETQHSYDAILKVVVNPGAGAVARGAVSFSKAFESLGVAEQKPDSADWNIQLRPAVAADLAVHGLDNNFRGWLVLRRDGSLIKAVPEGDGLESGVQTALAAEARWLTVKSLDDTSDPALANAITMRIIPVEVERDEISNQVISQKDKPLAALQTAGGGIQLKVDDYFRVELSNNSQQDLFVTILDLNPDGRIGPAFPVRNNDNRIPAGKQNVNAGIFRITPPLGTESFRAIVTTTPTDFTPLMDAELLSRTRSGDGRGADCPAGSKCDNAFESPLGKILLDAQKGKRGADSIAPPATWGTTAISFVVVPAP